MKTETAHAIVLLRRLDARLAEKIHPATSDGFPWSRFDWDDRTVRMLLGWHVWKLTGAHQLGLFGERRGPKAGIAWKRKRIPWLRVVFLNGARCASAQPGFVEAMQ